jgi:hypothetical protein
MCRDCYWWRDQNRDKVGLHNRNSDLRYFILKFQKIFNSLEENFEKIVFVHLFHFTFSVYF